MGLLEVLLVVFIVLKLIGVITWSWWLVLLPLWGAVVLYALMFLLFGAVVGTNERRFRKRMKNRDRW